MLENLSRFFFKKDRTASTTPAPESPSFNERVKSQLMTEVPLSADRSEVFDGVRFLLGTANGHEDLLKNLPMGQRREILHKIIQYLETHSDDLSEREAIQALNAIQSVEGELFEKTGARFKNNKFVMSLDFLRNGRFRRQAHERMVEVTQKVLEEILDIDCSGLIEEWASRRLSYTGLTMPYTKMPNHLRRISGFRDNIYYFLEVRSRVKEMNDVKALISEFGIENFSRYGPHALAHMAESLDDTESRFVTVISGGDWNGAFHDFRDMDQTLRNVFTDEADQPLPIRYVEAHTRREGMHAMRSLRRRFHTEGQPGKTQVVLVGYHGSPELMEMQSSVSGEPHQVTIQDLEWFVRRGYAECLTPDATIILNSCSTGATGGIGQRLSELLQTRVIGPDRPSGIGNIESAAKGPVRVKYGLGAKTMVYEKGQLINSY